MYTRDFYPTDAAPRIPDGYSGNAFDSASTVLHTDTDAEPTSDNSYGQAEQKGGFGFLDTLLSRFNVGRLLPDGVGSQISSFIKIPKIEAEEILLIAVAAFLFFSSDGDKLCALMVLSLLFV